MKINYLIQKVLFVLVLILTISCSNNELTEDFNTETLKIEVEEQQDVKSIESSTGKPSVSPGLTNLVPNGDFDSNANWTLNSSSNWGTPPANGTISNNLLITPDMWGDHQFFTVTSSFFTITSGSKSLTLSNGLHGGKLQLISTSNQIAYTYTSYAGYGSSEQTTTFNIPTGDYKIKLTYYGDSFADSGDEAQGTTLDYVLIN